LSKNAQKGKDKRYEKTDPTHTNMGCVIASTAKQSNLTIAGQAGLLRRSSSQ
jgi:hypothetical protein